MADGQPEAGAAELPGGGGIDLAERLEEEVELALGYADPGVLNGKSELPDLALAAAIGNRRAILSDSSCAALSIIASNSPCWSRSRMTTRPCAR